MLVRLQVLAVLDIIYLATCVVYKPYTVLRETMSAGSGQPGTARHQTTFTHAMLYVELAARGLASVSQTAIVWLVVMVTIDQPRRWSFRPVLCRPVLG